MVEMNDSVLLQVAAELEIRNVIAQLAQYADGGEVDSYLRLFTEDALWQISDNPRTSEGASTARGHKAIADGARQRKAASANNGSSSLHFVTTIAVEVTGACATVNSYFQVLAVGKTDATLRVAGTYHDTLNKTDEGWKMASRIITIR
jgi:ketosteroid isomerase-like protein